MKRIDLHLHTQNIKGDGNKRVIDTNGFIKKMDSNGIGICAITNHNYFDMDEFRDIDSNKTDFLLFTGIELDVLMSEGKDTRHIIVVGNPDNAEQFKEIFSVEKKNAKYFHFSYDEFIKSIKKFDRDQIVVIPHFLDKDKKRNITNEEKECIKKDLLDYIVILEPSKLRSMGIINAHNEFALIGSDIKDWKQYEVEALKLPEMKFSISSYGRFIELAKDSKQFVRAVLDGCSRESIAVESNPMYVYQNINIIFGGKGSGKTVLLKNYLYPQLAQKGFKVILHEGKDYHDEYENMLETFNKKTNVSANERTKIIEKLDSILNYSEPRVANFVEQVKKYCNNTSNGKLVSLIKKTDAIYTKTSSEQQSALIKKYENDSEDIYSVQQINEKNRDVKNKHRQSLDIELCKLDEELRERLIDKTCEVFSINQTDRLLKNLKSIIEKKTGKVGKPNNYGFAKLVKDRRGLIEKAESVIIDLNEIEEIDRNRIGELPDKGEIFYKVAIKSLKHDTKKAKQEGFTQRSNDNKKILKKIVELKLDSFSNINEYFTSEEKDRDAEELFDQIVIKERKVVKNDDKGYKPSDGEESILSITGILQNTDYDCYLFDEIERGLGNKYVAEFLIPQLKKLRDLNKYVILSTHNANIAIGTLPSQTLYCDYRSDKSKDIYYQGDMYSDELKGIDSGKSINWEENAIKHLEGGESMFGIRRNVWY